MAKRRRQKGTGGVERLDNGGFRAVHCRTVAGPDGKRKRVRASKVFATEAQAREWLRNQSAVPAAPGTVGDWLATWLELHKARVTGSTYRTDESVVRRLVRPHLAATRLRDLDALAVERWLAQLAAGGTSRGDRHQAGKVLRKSLATAVRVGVLPANPFTGRVRIPGPPKPNTTSLTEAEAGRLVAAADADGPYSSAGVRAWLELGLRPGEFVGLRWEDYDPGRGAITVSRSVEYNSGEVRPPKTPRVRPLPLSESARAALELHRGDKTSGWMFPNRSGGVWWQTNAFTRWFKPLCVRARVVCNPNRVRHTSATLALRAGASLLAVAERLGHSNPAMTLKRYSHALPDDQGKVAELWGKILGGKS